VRQWRALGRGGEHKEQCKWGCKGGCTQGSLQESKAGHDDGDAWLHLAFNGAVYYGLSLASASIGTDIYTGTALSGLAEGTAILVGYITMRHFGRTQSLTVFMTLSAFSCLVMQACSSVRASGSFTTALALVAKMLIAASFNTIHLYAQELFATFCLLVTGGCLCNVAARYQRQATSADNV